MLLSEAFRSCWLIATFGMILFLAGSTVLFWNEGRAVHTTLSLDEALNDAVNIPDATADLDFNYNDRIVHISGPIICGEPLTEPMYGIQLQAVKLKRRVQMYQWVEESVENNFGDSESRTYYYTREWRDRIIDSTNFYEQAGHQNPRKFPIESQVQVADAVYIGRYELGHELKSKFEHFVEVTADTRPEDPTIKMHLGLYYHTDDIFHPEVGDLRLLFSFAGMEGEVHTIVGKMENNKIVPYKTSRGIDVLLAYPGELGLTEIFKKEHQQQRMTTWGFRLMGWILVFFGVTCTSRLLHIILMRIHFLSVLAPDPQSPVGTNFILSFSLMLIIASIAWVLHRPMIGAGLLFAAASPFVWCARSVVNYQEMN